MMSLRTPAAFAQTNTLDRGFFPICVAAVWAVTLLGFVPEIIRHFAERQHAYPLIVHAHAAAFVGWLVLFSVQVLLIRTGRYAVHRTLGVFGVLLALAMLVMGPWASVIREQAHLGLPDSNPAFLSILFLEMISFIILVGAAVALRGDGAAHKRLMLTATLVLTQAGFIRWLFPPLHAALGDGVWQDLIAIFGGPIALIAGVGVHDLITRGRLHPAYIAGAAVALVGQGLSVVLYQDAGWKALALRIIGR